MFPLYGDIPTTYISIVHVLIQHVAMSDVFLLLTNAFDGKLGKDYQKYILLY